MITLEDIMQAQENIAPYAKVTPLVRSNFLSKLSKAEVLLKMENEQITNAFKIRGVINKLLKLSPQEKAKGVVTASAGNHGQAVALGAQKLGFSARIVVPTRTPKVKINGIKRFGADLVLFGDTYTEAERKAKLVAVEDGRLFISPYNDEAIVAGHGTIGLEIMSDAPNVDAVVVPVGGGGLIAGIGIAVKSLNPKIRVIGVQSAASPVMFESLKAGKIVSAHRHERYTIAEGLSGGIEKDSVTFKIAQQHVDEMMLVREESIRQAVYLLWKNEGQVIEGSGAVGVAMLLENHEAFLGQTIAIVVTGGNIDEALFKGIVAEEE